MYVLEDFAGDLHGGFKVGSVLGTFFHRNITCKEKIRKNEKQATHKLKSEKIVWPRTGPKNETLASANKASAPCKHCSTSALEAQ